MRAFRLINSKGAEYDLNDTNFFMHDPAGLGFERKADYLAIANEYKKYKDEISQKAVSGAIKFKQPNAYSKYHNFVRFAAFTPLTLIYEIFDTFKLPCEIKKIVKSEIEQNGLDCSIEFTPLGPWYKERRIVNDGRITGGKEYDYTYPYQYSDDEAETASINISGVADSPCKITIYGPITNPVWFHYVNGNLVDSGACEVTVAAGNKLVIDTTVTPYQMQVLDANNELVMDAYQYGDFSTERFILLEPGNNRITIGHESSTVVQIIVEARDEYESV